MEKFDKNIFRDTTKPVKVIIDTDPGVDDTACLIYAMFDENVDIKLLTTVAGNVGIDVSTRNLLHVLDLFDKDIPVAKGAARALLRDSETAEFIHQKSGMGGYTPPEGSTRKLLEKDAIEAMYETIMAGDGDINVVVLGPHTNIAGLIIRHPDVIPKIPKIAFMGGSPYGNPDYPDHISFNISSDPEAFKVVLLSGIPLLMCPSHMGRRKAHLDEAFVNSLENINDVGKFLHTMYSEYWEPSYSDKRITTNDTCTLLALVYPKLFVMKKVEADVNTCCEPGKTDICFCDNGKIDFVHDVHREDFLKFLTTELNDSDLASIKIKSK